MRVLLLGSDGQLGRSLRNSFPKHVSLTAPRRRDVDIRDVARLSELVASVGPEVIINSAAYTQVDNAESNRSDAFAVNSDGAFNVAQCAKDTGARLVQVSTNYVFAGNSSTPYRIDCVANPVNVYGESKLAGEKRVLEVLADDALVIRTAWLYSALGDNFVTTMLKLMAERPSLRIVSDQLGAPTSTQSLASAIWRGIERELDGVHHWTGEGEASWFDFAIAIQEEALKLGLLTKQIKVEPIRSVDYPTAARRPAYGVLDVSVTRGALGVDGQHWRVGLGNMLRSFADQTSA